MRYLLTFLLLTLSLSAAEPRKATVVDYFLQLPPVIFEVPPAQLLKFVKQPSCGVIDPANGYLSCIGDGAQPGFRMSLFRYPDGRPLIAICFNELEGPDDVDLEFYEAGKDGKLRKASRKLLPMANAEGRSFVLPREGRTILARDSRKGAPVRKFIWEGEHFSELK